MVFLARASRLSLITPISGKMMECTECHSTLYGRKNGIVQEGKEIKCNNCTGRESNPGPPRGRRRLYH